MGCACKVNKQIDDINKIYGSKKKQPKTNIKENITVILYNMLVYLLYIIFIPFLSLYILIRRIFVNKPILLDGFIKQKRNVRNK